MHLSITRGNAVRNRSDRHMHRSDQTKMRVVLVGHNKGVGVAQQIGHRK